MKRNPKKKLTCRECGNKEDLIPIRITPAGTVVINCPCGHEWYSESQTARNMARQAQIELPLWMRLI